MTFNEIKNLLSDISDPVQKLEMVMDLGDNILRVPQSALCTEIYGCSSFVEICRDGNNFYGHADSKLVRGILVIILSLVDGKTPTEIKKTDLRNEFTNLNLHLGASRLNGVNSMLGFLENL